MTNDQNAMGPETLEIIVTSEAAYSMFMTTQACPAGRHLYIRADIHEAVVKELSAIRAQLRIECQVENCNDWPDDLHLADVIEKHLCRKMAYERDALQRQLAQCRELIEKEGAS